MNRWVLTSRPHMFFTLLIILVCALISPSVLQTEDNRKKAAGAAKMAQWVKSLPSKHEDLSSDPWHLRKVLCVVTVAYNLHTGEADTLARLWRGRYSSQVVKPRFSETSCLRKKMKRWQRRTPNIDLWHTHVHVHQHTCALTHGETHTHMQKAKELSDKRKCSWAF